MSKAGLKLAVCVNILADSVNEELFGCRFRDFILTETDAGSFARNEAYAVRGTLARFFFE